MRPSSLVLRIKLALAGIVTLAGLTMVLSYWISDRSNNDIYAINTAGSLRMQTYRLALLSRSNNVNPSTLKSAQKILTKTWKSPLFHSLNHNDPALKAAQKNAHQHWLNIRHSLSTMSLTTLQLQLKKQIKLLDDLVAHIQKNSEKNARQLRLIQVISLFSILAITAMVIYWLRIRIENPLQELVQLTRRVSQGDFSSRLSPRKDDELGSLALTFNKMSESISHMHNEMENQINLQTQELKRSNTTLQFLYDTAKTIIEQETERINFEPILKQLKILVGADDIELCLITNTGKLPYQQIKPNNSEHDICAIRNCSDCLSGELLVNAKGTHLPGTVYRYSFPMHREQRHYGVLVSRMGESRTLENWQQQLMQSVADQIAMALSLQAQEDNARRLSLSHERTVIARELHDSLAQALSYLKIQVTRLNRALKKDDKSIIEDVSNELHEGLSSAYRQLRELLTTFRLKVDGPGLLGALQTSVKQLSEQTEMQLELDYQLDNLPLTPNEEVHLLQIVREACQNAIHHSKGTSVAIEIIQAQQNVQVYIKDNGIGITKHPDKLNHYGLAIMQERSKHLGGKLLIKNQDQGGTCVSFKFKPNCFQLNNVFARSS